MLHAWGPLQASKAVHDDLHGRNRGDRARQASASDDLPDRTVGLLTPALQRTLRQLLSGQTELKAARTLRLSPHTVHSHAKRIYREFGVHSRVELLARLLRPRPARRSDAGR